jgi:Fur family ferric uptake transcriptional regulator
MKKQLLQIFERVKDNGLKLTPARKIMLTIFVEADSKLLNAADLYDLVRRKNNKTNFSTVYRNLEILVEKKIIEKVVYNESIKYKLQSEDFHHHLMICTLCHKTEPLPFCPFGELEAYIKSDTDFLPTKHHVEIYGYCKNCRQQTEE